MRRTATALALVLSLAVPSAAWAACSVRDLAGSWRLMANGAIYTQDTSVPEEKTFIPIQLDCLIQFERRGKLKEIQCFRRSDVSWILNEPNDQFEDVSTSAVGRSCWVKINLVNAWFEEFVLDGQMTSDKLMIAGTGAREQDEDVYFSFTMVRQSR